MLILPVLFLRPRSSADNVGLQVSRIALLIALVFASSAQLLACAREPRQTLRPAPTLVPVPNPSPTPRIRTPDSTACSIDFWHSLTGARQACLEDLVEAFERQNPHGIDVRLEYHQPLDTEITTALSAGTPPDLVLASCEQELRYAAAGVLLPLADYLTSSDWGLSKVEANDLWPFVTAPSCTPQGNENSTGVMFDIDVPLLLINRTLLASLGQEAAPQTWEQVRNLCNGARNKKAGTWGCVMSPDGDALANWALNLGGQLADPVTMEVVLDSPEMVAVLSLLHDFTDDGCAYCVDDPLAVREDFASGEILFAFATAIEMRGYSDRIAALGGFDWEVAPVPHLIDEATVHLRSSRLIIFRSSERQQLAAWLLVKWLLRLDSDVQWAQTTGAAAMHRSAPSTPEIAAYLGQHPWYNTVLDMLSYARPVPAVPHWHETSSLLAEAARAVCQQQMDPAGALAAADAQADALHTP